MGRWSGVDSISAALFRGHIFWFGGDTLRLKHPLGQYWTSGAISAAPAAGTLDPVRRGEPTLPGG